MSIGCKLAPLPYLLKASGVQGLSVLGKGKKEEEGKGERKRTCNGAEDQPYIGAEKKEVENEV